MFYGGEQKILKPKLYDINAFDANKQFTFTFWWNGEQARGSRLTIRKNDDNSVICQFTYTSMKLIHVLPANTIPQNGICYNAYLEVLNASGEVVSDLSNSIVFWCYSTPVFEFQNISENMVIGNSVYSPVINYEQLEGEILSQYQVTLCDLSNTVIQSKGIQYLVTSMTEIYAPQLLGLENNTAYHIRATGRTLNGIDCDTGYIPVTVKYIQPSLYSFVELTNLCKKGYINIKSNLVTIRGTSNPPEEDLIYIEGTMADLREDGSWVEFSENFKFSENFLLGATFRGAIIDEPILRWYTDNYDVNMYYREGLFSSQTERTGYFELQVGNAVGHSIYTTPYLMPVQELDMYTIYIIKKNNFYQIKFIPKPEIHEESQEV